MGIGIDIRIDAHRRASNRTELTRHAAQAFKLIRRLDVEAPHPGTQRSADFLCRLANAGKDDAFAGNARAQTSLQFTAGNDVGAGAKRGHQLEKGVAAVGLDRITDQGIQPMQGPCERLHSPADVACRVHLQGRAETLRQLNQVHSIESGRSHQA